MEFIHSLSQVREHHQGCVATIGNFDGVHLGHQAVLQQLAASAQSLNLPSVAIIFEPQPLEFFAKEKAPARLTRLREKLQVLQYQPVDRVLCLRFSQAIADLEPKDFVRLVLVEHLGIRHLIVGDDFRYGCQRKGNFAGLQAAGEQYGFSVSSMQTRQWQGERISSTRIRAALTDGDLELAGHLLGRPYCLSGRVAYGQQLGRQLGFPTANIHLLRRQAPLSGVFAVRVRGLSEQALPGVANLGSRPSVNGDHKPILEVHLFDFSDNIYHRHVNVDFVCKLREEQRFTSLEGLKEQIAKDAEQARDCLYSPET